MNFDFTAVDIFLDYLMGRVTAGEVLQHPAYQAVCHHARLFSDVITSQDLEAARQGHPSPFYGLERVIERLTRIRAFLAYLKEQEITWETLVGSEMEALLPGEDTSIIIYPILGYDMGIGLDGVVCMNCNHEPYLDRPKEFLYFILHECVHVCYERHHHVPALDEVSSPADWRAYFALWLQNEGFAVYAPVRLRSEVGDLDERDYRVLTNSALLESHRVEFLERLKWLQAAEERPRQEYLECCFGAARLTYRMGGELFRRIEVAYGKEAVCRAFYLPGEDFLAQYQHLLETSR